MTPIRAAALALVLTCAVPAAHALDDLRPGLWEFRSTRLSLAGLPDMAAQMGMLQQHIKGLPADTRRMLEQQMQQRGVSLGADGSVRSCITPAQARQDNVFAGKVEGNCTLSDVVKAGNTVTGRLRCTGPDASGQFRAQIDSPERFTTRVTMRSTRGDLDVETVGRWLSANCGG